MKNELVEPRRMSMPQDIDLSTAEKCRDLLARYPDNSFLKDRLAKILRSEGRDEEATRLEIDNDPSDFKYHWGLLGYDERLRNRPSDAVVHLNRGLWHRKRGEWPKALSDYDRSRSTLTSPTHSAAGLVSGPPVPMTVSGTDGRR
jgi:hypothetical protein